MTFEVNGKKLERVKSFKYLRRILTKNNDNEACKTEKLRQARQRWNSIAKILKRKGAQPVYMARFYLTIGQAFLLYGEDTWVVSRRDAGRLRRFHWRVIRHMTGQYIRKKGRQLGIPQP